MGATVPSLGVPVRCHGYKHWVEWTVDEKVCQYHVVVRYQDDEGVYLGSAAITINDGEIRRVGGLTGKEAKVKFDQLVALYEAGKTAEEMVVAIENKGFEKLFADAWAGHTVVAGLGD